MGASQNIGKEDDRLHRLIVDMVDDTDRDLISACTVIDPTDPIRLASRIRRYLNLFAIPDAEAHVGNQPGIRWTGLDIDDAIVDLVSVDGPAGGGAFERAARKMIEEPHISVVRLISLAEPSASLAVMSPRMPLVVLIETGWWFSAKPLDRGRLNTFIEEARS